MPKRASTQPLPLDPATVARIDACPWFAHCGEAGSLPVAIDHDYVRTWREAREHMLGRTWEMAAQDASNRLSKWLFDYRRHEYNARWNGIAIAANEYLEQQVTPRLFPGMRPFAPAGTNVGEAVLFDVRRTLRGALLEAGFADLEHPITFFRDALQFFELGRYPCGWALPWPGGRYIVY